MTVQPLPIPNINIGQVYDQRYSDADIHYDRLGNLADFFGRDMSVHRHDRFFQLHYVKGGIVRVYLDEKQFVERGPMFFLTPPTVPHAFVTEPNSEGHVLTIRQQLVWGLHEGEGELGASALSSPICVALVNLDKALQGEADRLGLMLGELSREFETSAPGQHAAIDALTRLICISLFRLASQSPQAKPARNDDLRVFQRFNELIEVHYLEHLPLATYANELGVSEARLNDVCRRVAALSSKRLVLERVMQEAKRLLLYTGSTANEICYILGFKDPAYFSRFFHRYANMTPGEYRLKHSCGQANR